MADSDAELEIAAAAPEEAATPEGAQAKEDEVANLTEEQQDVSKVHAGISDLAREILPNMVAVQNAFDDLDKLQQLPKMDQKDMSLHPDPCPDAAKELERLKQRAVDLQDTCRQCELSVAQNLERCVGDAHQISTKSAVETRTRAWSTCADRIRAESERIKCHFQETDNENEEAQKKAMAELVQKRSNVMIEGISACLDESSLPLTLQSMYDQKPQACRIQEYLVKGQTILDDAALELEKFSEYERDLDAKAASSMQVVASSRQDVKRCARELLDGIAHVKRKAEEFYAKSIKHEVVFNVDGAISLAKYQAESMREKADDVWQQADKASKTLMGQAGKSQDGVHTRVKDAARQIRPLAEEPAQLSAKNTAMCSQLLEKLLEEKTSQRNQKSKELEKAKEKKAEHEDACKGKTTIQAQTKSVQLRKKVEALQKDQEILLADLQKVEELRARADAQLKDLLQLEEAGYTFEGIEKPQADVEEAWAVAPTDEPEPETQRPSVSEPAPSDGTISKKDTHMEKMFEQMQQDVKKIQGYRKQEQQQVQDLKQEMKQKMEQSKQEMEQVKHEMEQAYRQKIIEMEQANNQKIIEIQQQANQALQNTVRQLLTNGNGASDDQRSIASEADSLLSWTPVDSDTRSPDANQ